MEDRSKRTETVRPQLDDHREKHRESDDALSATEDENDVELLRRSVRMHVDLTLTLLHMCFPCHRTLSTHSRWLEASQNRVPFDTVAER